MSNIQKDIEDQAEEAQESSGDQHLGDAMDGAAPESDGTPGKSEAEKKRRLA
jgi:hypothetical protein